MVALYLSQISSTIGSLPLSIENFPGNVLIFSSLQFKPIFAPCSVSPSQAIIILPFKLCFSWLKALSFLLWVHILQAFEYLVCFSLGHLLHTCIFLLEHAQNKALGLNLPLQVLDGAISHLEFLAAVCIHAANDGVCLTPWPGSGVLASTFTVLYCCLIACPPQMIISVWLYL